MLKHKITGHSKKQRARRQFEKHAAAIVSSQDAEQRRKSAERQLANLARRDTRHLAILKKRDPVEHKFLIARRLEGAGVVKPIFEAA